MFRSGPSLLDKTASVAIAFAMIATIFSGVIFSLPQSVFAATTIFSDGFEGGFNVSTTWSQADTSSGGKWGISSSGAHAGDKSAQVNGDTGSSHDILRKSTSTTGYNNITLSFWYKADDLESSDGDRLELYYTTDGSTWTEVSALQVDDDNDDETWHELSYTFPSAAANNSSFGFRFEGDLDNGNDKIWVDDVSLTGDALDSTAPTLAEVTPVTTPTSDSTPSYTFSSTEAGTITYSGDCSSATTAAVVGNNTITFNSLSDGTHSNCQVKVTDTSSNVSSWLTVSSFEVDTTAPDTAIDSGPTGTVSSSNATFSFSANPAAGATFECKLDAGSYSSCSTPKDYFSLLDGSHTFYVRASDSLGNTDATPDSQEWTIDTDADNDGVNDSSDNCPSAANEGQTDTDNDGAGDACDNDIDGDEIANNEDNCQYVSNADQADTDENGVGDACSNDIDGDGVTNDTDNCPSTPNADQADMDDDGTGDVCDDDQDGDGVTNTSDNCPVNANADQLNSDEDSAGDACDNDDDNDEVVDSGDNCPVVANGDQADLDDDGAGDACDNDKDGDEVVNDEDNCPINANADQADSDEDDIGDACDDTNNNEPDVDVCPNLPEVQESIPQGYEMSEGDCVPSQQSDVDMCANLEGMQVTVPEGYTANDGQCTQNVTPPPPPPPPPPPTGGNGPIVGSLAPGQVLGAWTGPSGEVLGASTNACNDVLLTDYMRRSKKNDPEQVKILQQFLNEEMGSDLPITGVFGHLTEAAVKAFQKKYAVDVLDPWKITDPTGFVYRTTLRKINQLHCEALNIPMPELVPFSGE